jgi:hypothetical protein
MSAKYNSLEDFLNSYPLNVDGILNDGGGAPFSVKGIEINATILFADISSFSARTLELNSVETLIFVNNFITWMTYSGLEGSSGIVDKYIGDELMVIFAKEFGSTDPFAEAVKSAARMIDRDSLDFSPHIGIASGPIVVGYTGTPLKYNCSVFGQSVAMAARCASVKKEHLHGIHSIIFPASNWKEEYQLDEIIPPIVIRDRRLGDSIEPQHWTLNDSWVEKDLKNLPATEIRELSTNRTHLMLGYNTTERAKDSFKSLKEDGYYRGTLEARNGKSNITYSEIKTNG